MGGPLRFLTILFYGFALVCLSANQVAHVLYSVAYTERTPPSEFLRSRESQRLVFCASYSQFWWHRACLNTAQAGNIACLSTVCFLPAMWPQPHCAERLRRCTFHEAAAAM